MHEQGAVILGSGGDCCQTNRNASAGTFYEGAMVKGRPSDATENAVQADITADATFCAKPGNSGTGSSLQSLDYPAKYLRHYRLAGRIASDGGTTAWDDPSSWAQDSSRLAVSPWG